jgi:hypothetical protein
MVKRPESTIRNWAASGWLTRHGTGPRNRALYDADEARRLVDAMEAMAKVRDLHQPRWEDPMVASGQVWLVCTGCDEGAHAEGPAWWPCRTAGIVYTPTEIASREPPSLPECHEHPEWKRQAPVVFVRPRGGELMAKRWGCDHVAAVPVTSPDPWIR